jgi:hypothetical protein
MRARGTTGRAGTPLLRFCPLQRTSAAPRCPRAAMQRTIPLRPYRRASVRRSRPNIVSGAMKRVVCGPGLRDGPCGFSLTPCVHRLVDRPPRRDWRDQGIARQAPAAVVGHARASFSSWRCSATRCGLSQPCRAGFCLRAAPLMGFTLRSFAPARKRRMFPSRFCAGPTCRFLSVRTRRRPRIRAVYVGRVINRHKIARCTHSSKHGSKQTAKRVPRDGRSPDAHRGSWDSLAGNPQTAMLPDMTSVLARQLRYCPGLSGTLSGLPDMPRAMRHVKVHMCMFIHAQGSLRHARECRQSPRPCDGPLSARELRGDFACVAWRVIERGKAIAAARHVLPPSPALQRIVRLTPDRSEFHDLIEGSDQFPV